MSTAEPESPRPSRRADIPWDAIFAWMIETGEGPRAAARAHELPAGTVLAAVKREKERAVVHRLTWYVAGTPGGIVPTVDASAEATDPSVTPPAATDGNAGEASG